MNTPPIPSLIRDYALQKGLVQEVVERLWESHVRGSQAKGYDAGGIAWRRYVDAAVSRMNEQADDVVELQANARMAQDRRAAEARQKHLDDETYAREAITLEQYLDSLMLTERELTDAEERLLDTARMPGEDVGTYMMRALRR